MSKPIRRALCFICGLGQYEVFIDGHKVGNDFITPGWTQYAKTCLGDCYDATEMLKPGPHALSLHIGNGMYDMSGDTRGGQQPNKVGDKKAICQLMLDYADGTSENVVTDDSWRWTTSPESYSGVYGGEDWDARLEPLGWQFPGFDDDLWSHATVVSPPPGQLRGLTHAAPPIRTIEVRSPIRESEPKQNILVLDLGQNAPYVPEITVQGKAGDSIQLWPAEVLHPDGTVDQTTMRPGKHSTYTLRGGEEETWRPSFWYIGCRYWGIVAMDAAGNRIDPKPLLRSFKGLLVHADIQPVGRFECSSTLFNQIQKLIWWAMCSNFASVISDCPHREKSGWLEEDHLVGDGLMYSFDMSAMFRKVVQDMTDTQLPNGMVPTMAPEYFIYDGGFRDSVEWGGSFLLLPQMMQTWYGRQGLVAEHYEAMKRYVDYLTTRAKDGILSNGLGDWNGGGADPRTPVAITDTAYYFDLVRTLSRFAASLGRHGDAETYGVLATSIKGAFNRSFVNQVTGSVGTGSQSGLAVALDFGMIDPPLEHQAFQRLLEDVAAHDYAISCGEVGHPALLRVLTKYGRADLVAKIHLQTERPGYGYQIKKGLTTLAESWDASLISYNHFMLGHLMEWLYGDLVGIKPNPAGVAFSKIDIAPQVVSQVTWAKGSYDSARGRISSAWRVDGDRFHLEVTLPANTSGMVYVPSKDGGAVRITYPGTKGLSVFVSRKQNGMLEPIPVTSGHFVFDSVLR